MITQLRTKFKDRGFKIVLWITLFSMAIVFSPSLFKKGSSSAVVLTINGQDISYQDFQRRVHQETERIEMFKQQLGAYADQLLQALNMNNPQALAVQSIARDTLLDQTAQKVNLRLAPSFIIKQLNDPNFIVQELGDIIPLYVLDQQGNIMMPMLKRYLQRYQLSMADFEEQVEEKLKRKAVMDIASSALYISEYEIKHAFEQQYIGKKFSIAQLPFEKYLKQATTKKITLQELEEFFATQNKATQQYWVPEKRSVITWEFNPKDYGIVVSDADVENYYQQHKQTFLATPAQVQIRRILIKLDKPDDANYVKEAQEKIKQIKLEIQQAPEKFAHYAQQYSQDQATAQQGGLMEFFKKGEKDKALETAAFRLQHDNDISDIITTQDGFEIIQRVARKAATFKPLCDVVAEIKKDVLLQKFKYDFSLAVSNLIEKMSEETLQSFVKTHKGVQKTITLAAHEQEDELAQKVFKMKKHGYSFIINDSGKIIYVEDIKPTYEPKLDEVKKAVQQDFYEDQALQELKNQLEKAHQQTEHTSLNHISEVKNSSITMTDFIKLSDKENLDGLHKKNLPVGNMMKLASIGTSIIHVDNQNNGYLIRLDAQEGVDNTLYQSKKSELMAELLKEKKIMIERGFVASLYRNATIKATELLNTHN